jgi:Protein of unknown function (DUF3822)
MSANAQLIAKHIDKSLTRETKKSASDYKAYSLSIRVSLDGFSFAVYDQDKNRFLALNAYSFEGLKDDDDLCKELHGIFLSNELLRRYYPNIRVLFEGTKSTMVPFPLFDINEKRTYLEFNHKLSANEDVFHDELTNLEAYNVFAAPKQLHAFFKDKLARFKFIHYTSSLVETLLINHKNQNLENSIFVNVRDTSFDVVFIKGQKLKLLNSFRYRTQEDFAYYLLHVLYQLNLNPENVKVVFLGSIDKNNKLYEIMYRYIRNIGFIGRNEYFKYSYVFDNMPSSYYYNLLNAQLCEL